MNSRQRIVLRFGLLALLLLCLVPPWVTTYQVSIVRHPWTRPDGYGLIFAPPPPDTATYGGVQGVEADYPRLAVEVLALAAAVGIVFLAVGDARVVKPRTDAG